MVIGDCVRLNSGGPVMTIASIEKDEKAWCVWFEPCQPSGSFCAGDVRRDGFPLAVLTKAEKTYQKASGL